MKAGLPDTLILGPLDSPEPHFFIWENKAKGKKPSAIQRHVLDVFGRLTGPPQVEVIQPQDLDRCLAMLKRR